MTRRARAVSSAGVALGWIAAGGLCTVALARVWRSESVPVLIGVQGVAHWALLAAYPLVAFAVWKRRIALTVVAAGLAATQLLVMAGAVGWHGPQELPAGHVPIRVVTSNLLVSNPHIRQLGDELAAEDADIVLLQEVTPEALAELEGSALWTDYPYRASDPQPEFHGSATFSRFPIVQSGPIDVGGSPMLLTDLQTPAGPLRVVNVHTVAPLGTAEAATWAGQFPQLSRLVERSPSPIVLGGDFNATRDHAPLDRLLDADVRDAFDVAGSGLGSTWPEGLGPIPPLMRLDHVIVGAGVDVARVADRASTGSDHRRLVVDLGLPASDDAAPD
ncbi:endonuclease/exonuclease/phosphatase family protein [Homoserinibacter sp. GY 40078]|uniref:endonuclease/exonuclease/phosphatase family protein n=1 Tax=Homoserinibacter sp. GY 40078 TaxID=2603275 RepID=UPI0011C958CC|nr:endonuclease/exonuclease/phosphatase family protein [Homoserinibacter sp. GY 40078]TXK17253.1 hypothetical protein FVQ89_10385 [Homoserinibacter sp. GY 40078]